jgi:hypothetical protein
VSYLIYNLSQCIDGCGPYHNTTSVADLDGDGDLDAFIGSDKQGRIWLNDGRGFFTDTRQEINYSSRHACTLGDVDGDGTLDVVAGKLDSALVWFNDGRS